MVKFTDLQINEFIIEEKPLPSGYRDLLIGSKMKKKDSHKRSELNISGINGTNFVIHVRQNLLYPLNFSVILSCELVETTGEFRLRRYNGKHVHTNMIERNRLHDFHIHYATERYQEAGFAEDAFAHVASRYVDLDGALSCMIQDCNFILPPDESPRLL